MEQVTCFHNSIIGFQLNQCVWMFGNLLIHTSIRVVQFGIGLMLGLERCRVLGLLYGLSRLAIVFNNVLYMYRVLKGIYTLCFSRNFGGNSRTPMLLL